MNGLLARVRSFWGGLRRPSRLDAEMDEEMRFHIDMEAERLARERGLDLAEARRQAAVAFGGREKYKEEGRDARGLTGITGLSLDVRLARRMLMKSPGLTLVGGLAMAVAIAVGTGLFVALHTMIYPRLPLEEGDRIVAIQNWDLRANNEDRQSLNDFAAWRAGLRTVEQVSAFRMDQRQLITGGALPAPAEVAEMTASAFQAARVPPLLGRYILEGDEREGAPRVAVIGFDLWRARFGGDPKVVGRRVLIGDTAHTVIGVMPEGFTFPMDQAVWTALREDPSRYAPGEGPEIFAFGRLAPGATAEQAQAELDAIGRRSAALSPRTHEYIRPRILPYTYPLDDIQDMTLAGAASMQLLANLLLFAVAVNIAILVYARTAMRRAEIAVRGALGASRRRIVTQLFVESLLLSGGAAVVGLVIAHLALRQVKAQMEQVMRVGFWMDFGVRPAEIVFVAGLAVLAAAITGVLPALKSTGGRLQDDLRRVSGGTGMGLGRTWTVLIVAQVALAVAVLPTAVNQAWKEIRYVAIRPTFPADEYLRARLGLAMELRPGADADAYHRDAAARFGDRMDELLRRLAADPEVAGATFTAGVPGRGSFLEVEGIPAPPGAAGRSIASDGLGPGYFELFGARMLAGRGFRRGESGNVVVVSRAFATNLFPAGDALGRRVRFLRPPGEEWTEQPSADAWHEIIGVVEDLRTNPVERERIPSYVYYPAPPGQSATLLVRARGGDAERLGPRLRELTAALDPALRLNAVRSLGNVERSPVTRLIEVAVFLVVGSVILLSAAGIHALMSLTITQRTREIGIRTALGAHPRRLLASIFSRAMRQLALGGVIGGVLGAALLIQGRASSGRAGTLLGIVALLMLAAGLAATLGPARRGLRVQPMDALRAE